MGILFWICVFLIFYTYAGYPIMLFVVSHFFRQPKSFPDYFPTVTLLIAAYNEEKVIKDKIINSLSLDYPRDKLQILIAADGSNDRTAEIVRSFAGYGVELSYSSERNGKMAAIDRAMESVRGEILIMSDANNHYSPNAIRALVAPFQDDTVGATGGAKHILEGDGLMGESEGIYWKYESWIKKMETRLGCATGAAGEANAIRKRLYISPPQDTINDDFYLLMQVLRQGYRMVYVPDAKSSERISLTEADEIERRTRIIAGRYQAIARSREILPLKHPIWVWQVLSHKYIRPLVPFFMLIALLSTLVTLWMPSNRLPQMLWLTPPWNWAALATQGLFYLAAWLGSYSGSFGKAGKILYLFTYLVNSNLAAVKGFWRYVQKRQNTQWKRAQRRGETV